MEKAKRIGSAAYQAEQRKKWEILEFLLDTCNDGRRKGFFALAVNLLELEELQTVREELARDGDLPLKERAARAASMLRALADRRQVELKLRKRDGKRRV